MNDAIARPGVEAIFMVLAAQRVAEADEAACI
jgi:hypothetical protein